MASDWFIPSWAEKRYNSSSLQTENPSIVVQQVGKYNPYSYYLPPNFPVTQGTPPEVFYPAYSGIFDLGLQRGNRPELRTAPDVDRRKNFDVDRMCAVMGTVPQAWFRTK